MGQTYHKKKQYISHLIVNKSNTIWFRNLIILRTEEGQFLAREIGFGEEKNRNYMVERNRKEVTGRLTRKKLSGRARCRWKDNIIMDFKYIGINASNLVDSAQDRSYWRALVNAALNLRVP